METLIIFKDGTEIAAEVNGNNFIVNTEPAFPQDLSEVTVQEGWQSRILYNVSPQQAAGLDDRYWFILNEESDQEKVIRELREENELLEKAITELAEIIGGDE